MFENGTITDGVNINVDCGVCHNPTSYDMSKRTYNATTKKWDYNPAEPAAGSDHRVWKLSGLDSIEQAKICYRCHENAFRLKRGTALLDPVTFEPTGDDHHIDLKRSNCIKCHRIVSDNVKNDCSSCHGMINHKFARGITHVDISANDAPTVDVACTNCHSASKHTDLDGRRGAWTMTGHARLECQVCHTPQVGAVRDTIIYRRFRSINPTDHYSLLANKINPFEERTVTDAENGTTHTFMPFEWRWFDGTQDFNGDPVFTTRGTSAAKLTPVKIIKTYQANGTLKWGEVQVSHGTKLRTQAIRDCNLCHVTHRSRLGL